MNKSGSCDYLRAFAAQQVANASGKKARPTAKGAGAPGRRNEPQSRNGAKRGAGSGLAAKSAAGSATGPTVQASRPGTADGASLPHVREVEFMSPSSLFLLENDPVTFYLRRLGPKEFRPADDEQGFPAAVGVAFDAAVKTLVASYTNLKCPPLEELLRGVKTERERALTMGFQLLVGYGASGALGALLDEGVSEIEIHPEITFAPGTEVPIKGLLDATMRVGHSRCVHDWKVTGAGRPGGASPRQGYSWIWDTNGDLIPGKGHKKKGIPFHEIDEKWATQLAIYGWALGFDVVDRMASIDELVVGKDGRLRVACHRAVITRAFQLGVLARLERAWDRIKHGRVVDVTMAKHGIEFVRAMR